MGIFDKLFERKKQSEEIRFYYYDAEGNSQSKYFKIDLCTKEPTLVDEEGKRIQPINCPRCGTLMVLCKEQGVRGLGEVIFCNNCHLYCDCDVFHPEAYEYYHYLVFSGAEKDRMFYYYEGDQCHNLTYPKETVIREPIYMDENGRKFQPVNCPRCGILMVFCGDGYSYLICEKCGLRYSPHITLERRYREFLEGFEVGGMVARFNITSSLEIKKLLSKLSKAQ